MPRLPRIPLVALMLASGLFSGTACAETPAVPADHAVAKPSHDTNTPSSEAATTADTAGSDSSKKVAKSAPESEADRERRRVINRMTLEKLRLDSEMQIAQLKRRVATLDIEDERARLDADAGLRAAKIALENANDDIARVDREREITITATKASISRLARTSAASELELDGKIAKQAADNEVARLGALSAKIRRDNEAARVLDLGVSHPVNPVKDGTLYISDRRIVMNGMIGDSTAKDIITKLNFFSHADSKAPVFIVMETVPGGSVMAAYQIVKAIESCAAPVHVVAKSDVGGAASAIVAAAPYSYAIPHSRIVFQHPAMQLRGNNLGSQHDSLRVADSWFRLLYSTAAAKQGMTVEQFVDKLYEKNANGDWLEFGDKAVEAKWVNTLVERIVDLSVGTNPDKPAPAKTTFEGSMKECTDAAGATYFALPPLAPGDMWSIYDPEHRFRAN